MKPVGYIFLFAVLVFVYMMFNRPAGVEVGPVERLLYFMTVVIVGALASMVVLWEYFIKADFFEMPPIRYTRQFILWLRRRQTEDLRLRMVDPARFEIPAPQNDDALRDFELETMIRRRRWDTAEQYIREKLEFYRTDISQGQQATGFAVYIHYFRVLMDLRNKHLGPDDKKWADDIERYVSPSG